MADGTNLAVRGAFGEPVVYTPLGGAPVTIDAPFYDTWEEVSPETGVPFISTQPNILVRLLDLPAIPKKGDRFTITRTGVTYAAERFEPDGDGAAYVLAKETE